MNGSAVTRLVRKDLHLWRPLVLGALAAGGASIAMMPLTPVATYVGGVAFVCVLVILNIVLVMNGVVQERKDKVHLFILSLPVSTVQYTTAKVIANVLAFTVPWAVLTVAAFTVILVSAMPDGLLPFWTVLLAYLLAYYLVLLAVALVTDSSGWHATVITIGNVSINLLIPLLLNLPSIGPQASRPHAVWPADVIAMVVGELLVGAGALALAIRVRGRRADHV
jgi:hypothetical protein